MTKKIDFFSDEELQGGGKTRRIDTPVADTAEEITPVTPAGVADPDKPKMPQKKRGIETTIVGRKARASESDEDGQADAPASIQMAKDEAQPTVGWLVVMKGPGQGASVALQNGVCQIGRAETQRARIDFGDSSISREDHAYIAYDDEDRKFYMGHGGKSNLVRLNGKPVLNTETLVNDDEIRIGDTTLRFVAFCGPDFDWSELD